jgi:hypothetical protein
MKRCHYLMRPAHLSSTFVASYRMNRRGSSPDFATLRDWTSCGRLILTP